ncbi:UDP-glucose/GDP-mannose dehydrogenase family protein [Peribacillus saganii]|uniref:UDP-glucose 6-dehydrogenase n=1 Tax=Peribacillus saganii TaxID=2303992 RepID=A0A372LBI8_9BACI|nr:UDP-glucose/GDP-mannose dehydrogenase family protein [Peribacillus saganii]RFU62255.1 UDP-glucose/GDP-mannose dehydrogenase family protein [Peribacillus saganii]
MKVSIIGTGYVGLVTGVCLSDIGHDVTCLDINPNKINLLKHGKSPIYEPGLEELMAYNIKKNRLNFTTSHSEGLRDAEVVYIAVGTPQAEDGSADLSYVMQAAKDIACHISRDTIIVTKSTVPIGTNYKIKQVVLEHLQEDVTVDFVSNPEFLREGSAVEDTFNGERIVIGSENEEAADKMEALYEPFRIPVLKTSILSAEMIKYAANAFLATKISFINEIANIAEKVGADVEEVAYGIGKDGRIGDKFLQAGIGYGGSCFPKDTHALVKISEESNHDFHLLKSVIKINESQKSVLYQKAKKRFGSLAGKRVALLGLAFKPETDDMREAASITLSEKLLNDQAEVIGYDPIAIENAKKVLPEGVIYTDKIEDAVKQADIVFILTDWKEVIEKTLVLTCLFHEQPVLFDGRNCYSLEEVQKFNIEYHSVGREAVRPAIQERELTASF